jgi:hypothetical protein
MKGIIFGSLAASAIFAVAMSNADAAPRKHNPTGHYGAVAAKLKTVASRQLAVSEPSLGRPIAGDNSSDRNAYEVQKWGLLGP